MPLGNDFCSCKGNYLFLIQHLFFNSAQFAEYIKQISYLQKETLAKYMSMEHIFLPDFSPLWEGYLSEQNINR